MANLLSWLGGVANDIGGQVNNAAGAVNNFAVRPIQQAQNQAIRNVQRVAQPVANNFAEQAKRTALFKMQQDMARASANVQAGLRQGAGQVNNNIGFGIKVAQATPRAFQNATNGVNVDWAASGRKLMPLMNFAESANLARQGKFMPAAQNLLAPPVISELGAASKQAAINASNQYHAGPQQPFAIPTGDQINSNKMFAQAVEGGGNKIIGGVQSLPGVKNVIDRDIAGGVSTRDAGGFINESIVKPTLNQANDLGEMLIGSNDQKRLDKLGYTNDTKGAAKLAYDTVSVASLAYTGTKAAQLAKAPLGQAIKLAPQVALRQGASGVAQNTALQLSQGKKLTELDPTEMAISGLAYGALGTGIPLLGKIGMKGAGTLVSAGKNAIGRKALASVDFNAPQVAKNLADKGRLRAEGFTNIRVGKIAGAPSTPSPTTAQNFVHNADGRFGNKNKAAQAEIDLLKQHQREQLIISQRSPNPIEKQGALQNYKVAQDRIDVLENPKVPRFNQDAPKASKIDDLANEARKYKNVDDFEKSLNINYKDRGLAFGPKNPKADEIRKTFEGLDFHGTTNTDEILKSGFKKGQYFNSGAYFSDTPDRAIGYKAQNRGKGMSADVLVADLKNVKIKQLDYKDFAKIRGGDSPGEVLAIKLKRQGFDGIKADGETLVWNTEKIKTPTKLSSLMDNKSKPINELAPKADNYVYHSTNKSNIDSIKTNGLVPGKSGANGFTNEAGALDYAKTLNKISPEDISVVRVNKDKIKNVYMQDGSEIFTKDNIPASSLEVKINGKWQPLASNKPINELAPLPEPKLPKGWTVNKEGEVLTPQGKVATPHDIENMEAGRVLSKKDITQFDQKQADMNTHGRTDKPIYEMAPKPNKIPEVPAKKGIVTETPTLRKGLTGNKKVGDKLEIQLGKQYEANGGKVDYTGLNKGMQDHGIDLVSVNKDNSITLIQAKVRGQNTSLHERPVQAFFAASEQAKKQYPGRNINAVLHTTSKVDDDAIKFANSHGITIVQQNLDGTGQRVVTNSKRAVSDGVLDISDIDKQRIQNSIPVENRAAFLADINNPDSELSKVLSSVEPNKRFSMAEDWYKATNPQGTYELTSLKGLASKISRLDSPDTIKKMVRDDIAQNAKLNGSNPLEDALIKKLDDADFANRLAGETNPSKIRKLLNEVAGGDVYDPILKPTITKQALLKDVTPSTKITKVAGENKIEEAKTLLLNRFEPVEQFVRNKQKEIGRTLKPSENPTYYIKEFLGGGGIANAKIDGELTPIIRQTKQFDSLRQYMIAQRTNELADRGLSSKRADDVLSQIRSKVGDDEFKNFDKVANELYAFQKKELHQLVDVGVLTQQRFDDIVAKNQKYIPFNRVLPDGVSQLSQGGSKISSPKNPIKAIKGSDLEIIDPVESMIKNVYDIQATVQKQKVLNSLYKLAPDEFQPLKGGTLKTPAIEMFQNGKRVKLAADQDLSRALNSMDEENLNFAVRALSLPARTLRSGATGLNIGFVIPNVIRDQLSAAVNSKYGGIPIYDFMSGLASVIKKDDSYKKWILSGADQASFFAQDRKTLQRGVSDVTGNKLAQAGKYVKNPLEVFRIMGEYSEKGSRVGVFKRAVRGAKREGLTGEDVTLAAMRESREATIDFAQRGAKMKAINAMTPFLNARLQGSYKMIQSFKQRPVQTAAIGMAFAGAPAAALYIWNTQGENKKTYDEIPDYLKRENFILVTGNDSVPFIKVPKGEIGKIFGNTTESFLAAIKQEDSNWADTATTIADSFLPVGSIKEPARFVTDTMPTAASVPMQLLANYDAFRDKNIVGQYQKTLPAAAQSSKYNTETSKMIGEALNISPAKLEFAVSGFTGGLGRQGLQLVDAAMGNKIPVQELPVASRFMGEQKDLRNSADNLYESLEKQSAETALQNYKIKEALKKGDYSKLTGDTERDNRLKRSVAEEKLKETLNPKEKAMFGMTNEQLEDMGTDEANKILALKKSLSTSKSTAKNPKEKYEYALASYNEKKSRGEISDVNEMSEQKSLSKLKAQSDFSQDINDLYSKPNKEIDTYLRSKPNGGNIYNNLLALDDALVAQGFSSKFKDKYGNKKRLTTTSGTKAKKGRKASKKKVAQLPNLVKSGMFKSSKIVAKGTPTSKLSVKSLPKVSVGKNYA